MYELNRHADLGGFLISLHAGEFLNSFREEYRNSVEDFLASESPDNDMAMLKQYKLHLAQVDSCLQKVKSTARYDLGL